MRKSILLLPVLAGCGAGEVPPYTIIDEVPDRALPVSCRAVDIEGRPSPTEVRLATDSTWTLLDAPRRQAILLDDRLRVLHRTTIPALGPGAAEHPVSAAVLGDTAWAIAARGGLRIVVLSRDGDELATVPLDFIPHSMEALAEDRFLVTAMPFGTKPPTVLVELAGRSLSPVPVPRRPYPDMTINALGNAALVEALPDGSALVVHQFMEPRAFRVRGGGVSQIPAPTPAGTREAIAYVPTPPLTEEQLPKALVPAIAMTIDPARAEVYLLTRSGRQIHGRPERAVLRLDADLGFLQGYTLDVVAAGMVYLPRRATVLAYDDQDRFFSCPLPHAD